MKLNACAQTDVGRRRPHNEDAFFSDADRGFFVVADGVGGREKGEIASQETVDALANWLRRSEKELLGLEGRLLADSETVWEIRQFLEQAVKEACYFVFGISETDPSMKGMSTTCACLLILGGYSFSAHAGDSRVYRIRNGQLLQLTEDHTLENYKKRNPHKKGLPEGKKNVITRAIGSRDYVNVETHHEQIQWNDRFVLCSDGFHNYAEDEQVMLSLIAETPVDSAPQVAIDFANSKGGKDNITVIVVDVERE